MNLTKEHRRLLWLSSAEITADRLQKLISHAGSVEALYEDFGQGKRFSKNHQVNERLRYFHKESALDAWIERMDQKGIQLLFSDDPNYPDLLRSIDDPPYLLYCMGDVSTLRHVSVGVVGTRHPSGYGKNMARKIAGALSDASVCIVSGMAIGIDASAHQGALEHGGKTVAVLGNGFNSPYPSDNLPLFRNILNNGGAVISEYPTDAKPMSYHFPHRNRVISGLSRGIVFVEGQIKSGGMLTVKCALDQGREVFAVPGNIEQYYAEGPNQIISEGAVIVTSVNDILDTLGLAGGMLVKRVAALPDEIEISGILSALQKEAMGMDALQEATGLKADELMTQLCMLEINGDVARDSGNVYRRTSR